MGSEYFGNEDRLNGFSRDGSLERGDKARPFPDEGAILVGVTVDSVAVRECSVGRGTAGEIVGRDDGVLCESAVATSRPRKISSDMLS